MELTGLNSEECPNIYLNSTYTPKNFAEELSNAVSKLTPEQPYQFFDLGLSYEDIVNLEALKIEKSDRFTNLELIVNSSKLKAFIESLSPENANISESITNLITNMVNNAHNDKLKSKDTVNIFFLTTSDGNDRGEQYEWHLDTLPYKIKNEDNSKRDRIIEYNYFSHTDRSNIVISLKGPTTWIYPMSDENRDEYNFVKKAKNNYRYNPNEPSKPYVRPSLQNSGWDLSKVVKADFGQGAVFKIDQYQGALHSTPIIKEERLFMAIVNVDKETAEGLVSNEGKKCYGQTLEEYENNRLSRKNHGLTHGICNIVDPTIFKMR